MGLEPNTVWPKRGEIYLVNFDPAVGSEIQKTRPAIILQNNFGNEFSETTIVAAITAAGKKSFPVQVEVSAGVGGLDRNSLIQLNQIRTMDKSRLMHRLGAVDKPIMRAVDKALLVSLGIIN